jgi:cytochrome c553
MQTRHLLRLACAITLFASNRIAYAAGDAAAGERKAEICVACHGPAGNSAQPNIPSLAAQPPLYIFYQLLQFREQRRIDPAMSPMAANLSDRDMQDLGAYFSSRKATGVAAGIDKVRAEKGAGVAERNHCQSCHAASLTGQNHIPRLAGQHMEYLRVQLKGFRTGTRPDIDGTMSSAAQPLSDDDIENLVHFIASLAPPVQ